MALIKSKSLCRPWPKSEICLKASPDRQQLMSTNTSSRFQT